MRTIILFVLAISSNCIAKDLKIVNLSESEIEQRVYIERSYEYSNDVIRGVVISKEILKSNNRECKVPISTIKIIESFKGQLESNEIIQVYGIEGRQNIKNGSEQLLFLSQYKNDRPDNFRSCNKASYEQILRINSSCCSIKQMNGTFLIMNHEVTSEDMSEYYLVNANSVFEKLRALKEK
jgi:hypothetical protein